MCAIAGFMNITILAIGKTKDDATTDLVAEYCKRLSWRVKISDLPQKNKADDGARLIAAIPKQSFVIALDEHGDNLSSQKLAAKIQSWQNAGHSHLCFIIGGADGLSAEVLRRADFNLALGKMTWPHRMVKVMILEQLYRANTILSGHPYHRE